MRIPLGEISGFDWPVGFFEIFSQPERYGVEVRFVDVFHALLIADLEGWRSSVGVKQEIDWFAEADKPIYLLGASTLAAKPWRAA
jgi:hypothetical protein